MPSPTQQEQQPPSPRPFNIAIIGAGITGLTLAIGLYVQLQNSASASTSNDNAISFTVYERAPTLSASAGAGIGLSPNAERAMQLLAPQVHEAYERVANPNGEDWFQWVDGTTGELLFKLHVGKGCFRGCKRADFLEELVECLPRERVKFGKSVREVRSARREEELGGGGEEGGVVLEFEDGTCEVADAVIGCDGIHSPLRAHLFAPDDVDNHNSNNTTQTSTYAATYTHKAAFRALVPMADALAKLGPQKVSTRYMYNGPGAHIITYPVAQNTALNLLVVVTDPNEWEQQPAAASSSSPASSSEDPPSLLPTLPSSLDNTQSQNHQTHAKRHKHTRPATRTECLAALQQFHPSIRAIAELLPQEMDKWAIYDMQQHPAPRYHSRQPLLVLAGDAAHAAGPHLGAAAGFGIEDACLLATLLRAAEEERRRVGEMGSGGNGDGGLPPSPPYDDHDDNGVGGSEKMGRGRRFSKTACLQTVFEVYTRERLERTQWLMQHTREIVDLFEWEDEKVARDPDRFGHEVTWRFHEVWHFDVAAMLARTRKEFAKRARGGLVEGRACDRWRVESSKA